MNRQQPSRVARYNRTAVLNLIRRAGPISQSELAEMSGLAPSSVQNITRSLLRRGLVRSIGNGPSSGGRPPKLLELNAEAGYAIGVNVRLAGVECVLVDLLGDIVAETVVTVDGVDVEGIVDTVREAVDEGLRLASVDPGRVLGVGVGFPGLVQDGRTIVGTPEFPGWGQIDLRDALEQVLGMPVIVENNANLAALAEYRQGVGRDRGACRSLVYVYVDHGIGSGIVLDGRLWTGAGGFAGEFGHTVIDVNGPLCTCGTHGCLEAVASIAAVLRRAIATARLHGVDELSTYPEIAEALEAGDTIAIAAIDEAMGYLAAGITNLDRQIRPDVIVVGGDLFKLAPDTFRRLDLMLDKRPPFWASTRVPVLPGELGTQAPSVGAGTVVLEHFFGEPGADILAAGETVGHEPLFESTPLWPVSTEESMVGLGSVCEVSWAGNLQPITSRLRAGESLTITIDARLEGESDGAGVKALLHWDRVPLFGGSWPSPKNSPMRFLRESDGVVTYSVTLGALPAGKYEFAVHLLGANEVWVPGARKRNARVEVLQRRPVSGGADVMDETAREEETASREVTAIS